MKHILQRSLYFSFTNRLKRQILLDDFPVGNWRGIGYSPDWHSIGNLQPNPLLSIYSSRTTRSTLPDTWLTSQGWIVVPTHSIKPQFLEVNLKAIYSKRNWDQGGRRGESHKC